MDFEQITTDLAERVLTITLNRPDRLNAWTAQMGSELIEAFDRADADDEVRAVIVTGAGRGFCAGADLASGGETFDYRKRESAEAGAAPRDNGGQFTLRVFRSTKPVIAAINGPAQGELLDAAHALAREIAENTAPVSVGCSGPGAEERHDLLRFPL